MAGRHRRPSRTSSAQSKLVLTAAVAAVAVQPLVAAMAGQAEGWGRVRLVLVHHRLRLISGMDLVRKLVEVEGCPVPILVVGTEEGEEQKRERARSLGAMDFVPVQPFRILTLKLALEEALRPWDETSVTGLPGR